LETHRHITAVVPNGPDKAYAVALRAVLEDPHADGVICVAIGNTLITHSRMFPMR